MAIYLIQIAANGDSSLITCGADGTWMKMAAGVPSFATLAKADVGLGNVDNTSDANKPVSTATQTALNGKQASGTYATGTGSASGANTGDVTTNAIGYASGAGGTVTQATNKSTGVTLNKLCGTITMNGAALAAAAIVTFTVTNNQIAATDVIHAQHDSVGTIGAYTVMPNTSASGSFKISIRNNTAGSLSEAIVIRFAIIKAVAA